MSILRAASPYTLYGFSHSIMLCLSENMIYPEIIIDTDITNTMKLLGIMDGSCLSRNIIVIRYETLRKGAHH
jgi:hypothetical protein